MKRIMLIVIIVIAAIVMAVMVMAAIGDTAMARSIQIQATLSPDITIRYNGEVQAFTDAGGNAVYPITYNGTTYLPLRAVSDMLDLPVNWVGETRTVELGATASQPKSLLAATDAGRKTTSGNVSQWVKVQNRGELPGGGVAHTDAIKTDSIYMTQQTKSVFKLDRQYAALSFTAYNTSEYVARVQVINAATQAVLWSANIEPGTSILAPNINILATMELEFAANLIGVPLRGEHYYNAVYICDPLVK